MKNNKLSYKIDLLPIIFFIIGRILQGIIAMFTVGIFVGLFMVGIIFFHNEVMPQIEIFIEWCTK